MWHPCAAPASLYFCLYSFSILLSLIKIILFTQLLCFDLYVPSIYSIASSLRIIICVILKIKLSDCTFALWHYIMYFY